MEDTKMLLLVGIRMAMTTEKRAKYPMMTRRCCPGCQLTLSGENGTKIKLPNRNTPKRKDKTFTIADDSDDDLDNNLASQRRKVHTVSDDDDDEEDEDDDEDEDDEDDEDDDVQVTRVNHGSATGTGSGSKKKSSSSGGNSGLQRERGSDGEFIDVESASEQSDADSF